MKKIWIVIKDKVENLPPVQSIIVDLLDLSYEVCVISTDEQINFRVKHYSIKSKKNKVISYLSFRLGVSKIFQKGLGEDDIVWVSSLDTALSLYRLNSLKKIKMVMSLYELYDKFPLRIKIIKGIAEQCDSIIVPEYNRAHILRVWLGLNITPIILPNKPTESLILGVLNGNCHIEESLISEVSKSNKIKVIYQGHIGKDRNIEEVARVCFKNKDIFELYLMGKDHGFLSELRTINPELIYLGHIPSPNHLVITSLMDIGILHYTHRDLNNVFCAPNKIWEYSAFGLAILSNDLPGIKSQFLENGLGECYSTDSEVESSLLKISEQIIAYKKNSKAFYSSVNRHEIVQKIVG